jgi:hypothetical protein
MEDDFNWKSMIGGILFGLFLGLVAVIIVTYSP